MWSGRFAASSPYQEAEPVRNLGRDGGRSGHSKGGPSRHPLPPFARISCRKRSLPRSRHLGGQLCGRQNKFIDLSGAKPQQESQQASACLGVVETAAGRGRSRGLSRQGGLKRRAEHAAPCTCRARPSDTACEPDARATARLSRPRAPGRSRHIRSGNWRTSARRAVSLGAQHLPCCMCRHRCHRRRPVRLG